MAIAGMTGAEMEKPAFIAAEGGTAMSFAELDDKSARLARALRGTLSVGDRIALLMHNGPAYFVAAWAARRAGLRYVPVNWHLGPAEAAYIIHNSDARALIMSAGMVPLAEAIAAAMPMPEICLAEGGAMPGFEPLDAVLARHAPDPLDLEIEGTAMFYSSGTTGQPKGILRPLPDYPYGERSGLETVMANLFAFDAATRFYSPAPLYHAAPLGWSVGAQGLGGTAIIAPGFDAEATLRHIEEHRVTHAQFVPTHFVRLLKLPEEVRGKYDLSSLRMVVHSAAPCPVEVKERMMDWWGPIIHEYYSQSEGAGFTYVGPADWLTHKGTVGRSISSPISIVDDQGAPLPVGETGHIVFDDVQPFEYHKDPDKTADFFTSDGVAKPGDMGWVDAEGFLYLTDRASHMIISGGVNIYPQEAEAVLTLHPAVQDVAVIGVPNADFGEEVKAVVLPVPGVEAGPDLADALMRLCREQLAGYKCPRSVDFVDTLPRLPTGKLLKREIRKAYWPEKRTV